VVLIVIGAQAVRTEVFSEPGFWIPTAALAGLLIFSTVTRWEKAMATAAAPWIAVGWILAVTLGLTAIALVPEMRGVAEPILFGIAAVSGLLLTWWMHAFMTVFIGGAIAYIDFNTTTATSLDDVLGSILTVAAVGAATALVGMELEREAILALERENQIEMQRKDFERLYAVSSTLAHAESLSEIVPHLIGTICKYLDAQVGAVLLYDADHHRLETMSPIWVNGQPIEAETIVLDVSAPGIVAQTYRAGKPWFVMEVDHDTDAHTLLKELGLRQALVAPLKVEDLRVGVIIVGDPYEGDFNEDQLEQLGSLAAPAGLVLSQIGRYEAQTEMTSRLEEVAQMKTDFVSTVSHELRTPLTSIIGSLDTVNRPELAPQDEMAQQLLGTARRQAGRLQRLIDDLLVVSRIDRGAIPVHLEPVAVQAAFDEVKRVVSIKPTFTIEPADLKVEADRDHLSRILINLVENAAKYASGSSVELFAWEKVPRAFIAVVDHGPGIPEEDKDRVFERFTQIDQSDTRSKGGTGLGLSIVKSLTEVMNGGVRVESTEGGGATFVIELPLAHSQETVQTVETIG
jgi:signal transduction histidine kinase